MEENPYLRILKKVQAQGDLISLIPTESLNDFDLGGVDCEICKNTGLVTYSKDGFLYSKECECMTRRRIMKAVRNSGMEDMLQRYTFEAYKPYDDKTAQIKQKAIDFTRDHSGWYYIAGRAGSGKSHICVAICNEIIKQGKTVRYMLWRDDTMKLKACVNDESYEEQMDKFKKVGVLYIDDFLKGNYTDADIKLAFELLNYRYNDMKLRTVISSELAISKICEIDEAVGSRIYERSKNYCMTSPKENYRLR